MQVLKDIAEVLRMNGASFETRVRSAYTIVTEAIAKAEPKREHAEEARAAFDAQRRYLSADPAAPPALPVWLPTPRALAHEHARDSIAFCLGGTTPRAKHLALCDDLTAAIEADRAAQARIREEAVERAKTAAYFSGAEEEMERHFSEGGCKNAIREAAAAARRDEQEACAQDVESFKVTPPFRGRHGEVMRFTVRALAGLLRKRRLAAPQPPKET